MQDKLALEANVAWRLLADAADRMLTGELSFLDGARVILAHRRSARIPEDDPDIAAFVAVESETDHLPVGAQRRYWSNEALHEKASDVARAEAWARKTADAEAQALLMRFAERSGCRDRLCSRQLLRRRVFFDTYHQNFGPASSALQRSRRRVTCPCCGYPTLDGRAAYEICFLCWWEDDGQDDDNARQVLAGPNQRYSLCEARENFARYKLMHPPDRETRVGGADSLDEIGAKQQVLDAFDQMMCTSETEHHALWEIARVGEHQLHRLVKTRRGRRSEFS